MLVRYEDFLADSHAVVGACSKAMRIAEPVHLNMDLLSQGAKSRDSGKTLKNYQDYYLGELWRRELYDSNVKFINSGLDLNLVELLGYKIL